MASTKDPPQPGLKRSRRDVLYLVLSAVFLSNALLAEMVGGRLFEFALGGVRLALTSGVLLWPIVFITTDLVNEYFGRAGVRRLSLVGAAAIAYAFVALWLCGLPPAASFSPITDAAYQNVFRQSRWIIAGSIAAFLVSQLVDVTVFWAVRRATGPGRLWARATGSTVVSQLVDTFIVGFIGLHLPYLLRGPGAGIDLPTFLRSALSQYGFKLAVAVAVTPVLYVGHALVDRWIGAAESASLVDSAARDAGIGGAT